MGYGDDIILYHTSPENQLQKNQKLHQNSSTSDSALSISLLTIQFSQLADWPSTDQFAINVEHLCCLKCAKNNDNGSKSGLNKHISPQAEWFRCSPVMSFICAHFASAIHGLIHGCPPHPRTIHFCQIQSIGPFPVDDPFWNFVGFRLSVLLTKETCRIYLPLPRTHLLYFLLGTGSQRGLVYLGWPIAPSYMSLNAGRGGSLHGAQINFGDLTPYLTYAFM